MDDLLYILSKTKLIGRCIRTAQRRNCGKDAAAGKEKRKAKMSLRNVALCLVLFCQVSCNSWSHLHRNGWLSAALELTKPMRTGLPVPFGRRTRSAHGSKCATVAWFGTMLETPIILGQSYALLAMGPELTLSNQANGWSTCLKSMAS